MPLHWNMPNRYDPDIHKRRSIRLKGYDYSQHGAYFITICTKNRECLFGHIKGDVMHMNDAGRMIEKWWLKLPDKFPSIQIDSFVVMPNHFHGIIQIVGADPCVCPDNADAVDVKQKGAHVGTPLQKMIQWFKTMTTNEYITGVKQSGWPPFEGKLWQRNYYDHIIRDEKSLKKAWEYIVNNPLRWDKDDENPDKK